MEDHHHHHLHQHHQQDVALELSTTTAAAINGDHHSTADQHSASSTSTQHQWNLCGQRFPKNEVVFFGQLIILYVVILTSIINLSLDHGDRTIWIGLLCSSLGYLLPNPSIKQQQRSGGQSRDPSSS